MYNNIIFIKNRVVENYIDVFVLIGVLKSFYAAVMFYLRSKITKLVILNKTNFNKQYKM